MTGRTHEIAAITALGAVVYFEPPQTITLSTFLICLLANQIGGIAPDVDQPTAPFWKNLPEGKIFGKFTGALLGGHRFISHSILGLGIFGGLAYLLLHFLQPIMPHTNIGLVWWSFMIGMLSHLVMDTFTKEGVPWLLPVPTKFGFPPIKRLRITTGHFVETLIVFPLILILDVWFCVLNYNFILLFLHNQVH